MISKNYLLFEKYLNLFIYLLNKLDYIIGN